MGEGELRKDEIRRGYMTPRDFRKQFTDLGLYFKDYNSILVWAISSRNDGNGRTPRIGDYSGELNVIFFPDGHQEMKEIIGIQVAKRP